MFNKRVNSYLISHFVISNLKLARATLFDPFVCFFVIDLQIVSANPWIGGLVTMTLYLVFGIKHVFMLLALGEPSCSDCLFPKAIDALLPPSIFVSLLHICSLLVLLIESLLTAITLKGAILDLCSVSASEPT